MLLQTLRREAIDDATLLEIVWGHLYLHAVAGENAYTMDAHPPCKRAKQLVILGLLTGDTDSERRIGEGFFHNADEF